MLLISILFFVLTTASLVARDLMRGKVQSLMGDPSAYAYGRMTPDPRKHIDSMGWIVMALSCLQGLPLGWTVELPFNDRRFRNPKGAEWFLAFWGVFPHLILAGLFAAAARVLPGSQNALVPGALSGQTSFGLDTLASYASMTNLYLALFALLPLYPLEGLRVLKLLLAPRSYYSYSDAVRTYAPHIYVLGLGVLPFLGLDVFGQILTPGARWLLALMMGS